MTKDASQGQIADPAKPEAHEIPEPNGVAILRKIGTDIKREDVEIYTPRPAAPLKDKQDWHRG
jgi:hypothetical protein